MVLDILKRDLKRKKTMNIIILLFVVLSTMFIASSVNNIISVFAGTEYYFEKAQLGDYEILTMGEHGRDDLKLEEKDMVKGYRVEDIIFISQGKIKHNGEEITLKNTGIMQCLNDAKLNFFNENNEQVTSVEAGKVYLTAHAMENNGIKAGDEISFETEGVKLTLEVAGRLKDALLGSDIMGNTRFLMSPEDYDKFESNETLHSLYAGRIYYVDSDDTQKLSEQFSKEKGIAFNEDSNMIRNCYMVDMVVAGILLAVSICLILVAFVVLKFTINFTISEEFREIGVMKAIGIKDGKIRTIYLAKYMMITIVGALIGFVGSFPLAKLLLKSVSENMVLGNDAGIITYVVSTLALMVIIISYAYFCTRKVKKLSPIDAIRSGQSGERFKKKSVLRIGKSKLSTTGYMALNDVLSSPKRYLTIVLAFTICSLLVFMLINTSETVKSDKMVTTLGKACDAYYTDVSSEMDTMTGDGMDGPLEVLGDLEKKLKDNGMEADASIEVQFKYMVAFDGKEYKIACQQGVNTHASDYEYYEGSAPQNANEIAITNVVSELTGAKIGDTLEITVGDKKGKYLVTAYYQSMNLMGKVIRLHEDVKNDMRDSSSLMSFQLDFKDNPSKAEIDKRVEKMKDIFGADEVFNAAEYTADCIGVTGTIDAVKYLLLLITLVVVVMVTVLMERSFVSDEKGEIAILKAVGFSDASIIKWHIKRFVMVGAVAVLIAIILSIPVTNLAITPIFGIMGLKSMELEYNLLQVLVVYPAIIIAVTILAASFTALSTKRIASTDTSSIE